MAAEGHCFFFLQGSIGVPVHLNQDQYIYIYINDVTPKESGIAVIFCQSPGMPMSLLV